MNIEEKLEISRYDQCPLVNSKYQAQYKLSDSLFLNIYNLESYSDLHIPKNYLVQIREAFELENKRIIQFYEDEVSQKWDIIASIINNSLNKSKGIYARNCDFSGIPPNVASDFLNKNHLMGRYMSAKHFGLMYKLDLCALMSVRMKDGILEISRFCNKNGTHVVGGFSKLLSHILVLYKPDKIISFCDLRYATGKGYEGNNFKLVGISKGWSWTDFINRYNRLMCKAGDGHTENENALIKGWVRIHDAGQAKYEVVLSGQNQ